VRSIVQLQEQEEAAYAGSDEQRKHLVGVSFRAAFDLILLALPVAKQVREPYTLNPKP